MKPETAARAKRASIGTTACASGFGVAFFFNGRNAQVDAHDGDILTDALRRMTDAPDSEGWQCVRKLEIDTGPSTLSIASSNTTSVGFRRPLLATFYAATQTIGVNRAPSLEMVIGVAAP